MRHPPTSVPRVLGRLLCAVVSLLMACAPARAQTSARGDSWQWARFSVDDGLPSDVVVDVTEAADGTVWAMTQSGIAWFDGFRWRSLALPQGVNLRSGRLVAGADEYLYTVAGGRLLVVDKTSAVFQSSSGMPGAGILDAVAVLPGGRVLALGRDRVVYEWRQQTFRPSKLVEDVGPVKALLPAKRGAWLVTERGLVSVDGVELRRYPTWPTVYRVVALAEGAAGSVWASVADSPAMNGLWKWDGPGQGAPILQRDRGVVTSMVIDKTGDLLAVQSSGALTRLDATDWEALVTRVPWLFDARRIATGRNGDVWVATEHGLFLARRSDVRWAFVSFKPADGRNAINDLYRDKEGLWLATAGGLLKMQRSSVATVIDTIGRDPIGSVTTVKGDLAGRLWIGSGGSFTGVRWLDDKGWHRLTTDERLDRSYIHRIAVDHEGGVWFLALVSLPGGGDPAGTETAPGAFRLSTDGRITRFEPDAGKPISRTYAFSQGPDGSYWFGSTYGLSRWSNGVWQHWRVADGLKYGKVFTLAIDKKGILWLGHQADGGLGRFDGTSFTYFTTRDGLASDDVWNVAPDPQGRVWVSCLGGLSVLDRDEWTTFDHAAGLRSTRIWPVLPAGDHVYVGTNGGGIAILNLSRSSQGAIVEMEPPLVESRTARVSWRAFSYWGEFESASVPTRVQLDDGPWSAWSLDRTRYFTALTSGTHTVNVQAKSLLGERGQLGTITVVVPQPLMLQPAFFVPMAAAVFVIVGIVSMQMKTRLQHRRDLHAKEVQLQHAHRMESVGRLAGGIAHDFNNLLTVITGNATLLEGRLEPEDDRLPEVDQIRLAADRATRLTRQLLTFARKQVSTPRAVRIGDVLKKMSAMLRPLLGGQIGLVVTMPDDVAPVFIDPGHLEQVLVNMAVNARDAMPAGGKLTIRTQNLRLEAGPALREPDMVPGEYVRIEVIDTGAGMKPEVAAKVFDPFFTTKDAGTGLGLATCYGIIREAKGQITVASILGHGTTFLVDLPASQVAVEASTGDILKGDDTTGTETVLLVEDEIQVRKLAATALRNHGYIVLEASDGDEALKLEASWRDTIDVLVTDVVMPMMRGTELARRFVERRPGVPVIFMSGFVDDATFREEAGSTTVAFLSKPFALADLTRMVRGVLDRTIT